MVQFSFSVELENLAMIRGIVVYLTIKVAGGKNPFAIRIGARL
jgi:hypothetical protein